ncbi:uncharacterized protein LOC130734228 [Lotus japonicus]|uniref:uncharacterized protein LOC130734228 n=1 Tax=Lotus japonicus TaxID=34305 RepID=UPI002590320C|nr:uncharacterized protein LOC130734228 [Lotus japonicus]
MGFSPSFISEAVGFSGGIWVMTRSNANLSVRLLQLHTQVITFEIWRDTLSWACSAVYASPVPAQREVLWQHLTHIRNSINIPWLLVRDMNEILLPSEVRGGEFIPSRAQRFAAVLESSLETKELAGIALLNSWQHGHPSYQRVVELAWQRGEDNIMSKLECVRQDSETFNKETFGDILRRKRWVEGRLRGVQRELNTMLTSALTQLEAQLQGEYRHLLKQEELLWFQRARGNNVRFGDRNTAYFHAHVVIRKKRNKIHRLKLADGEWCSDQDRLATEVQSHFQSLFAAGPTRSESNFDHASMPQVTTAEQRRLSQPAIKEEVRRALMTMDSYTAPGIDGFQPYFFKKYWDIVSDFVWKMVAEAFEKGTVPDHLLETLVVLIPKVDSPSTVKELRPISLCKVTYKLLTKVIVTRMRSIMSRIIGPMQNSFLPGRGTMDNAFLAQEIIHHMNTSKARKGSLAFKIDLEKAYDSISWDFLEETLHLFGFPYKLVDLIMYCVRGIKLNLLWNGSRLPAFHPGRGLRQGDPLSPYLFVLCMERLSIKIHQLVDRGDWKPLQLSPNGPPVSHLFFADDVLLFCQASSNQVQLVANTLQGFCDNSGLKINMAKSKALSSKRVPAIIRDQIRSIAPIPFVHDLGQYLGFPLSGGRHNKNRFHYLIENINRKLASWKTNLLNLAGRVCLAKAVISSIPTYTMQVFWLPRNIIDSINQTMRRFIWSRGNGHRGWHLVKWSTVTQDKETGGLGVKDMADHNTALLGKAVWNLLQNSNKLWVQTFTHKYLQGHSILSVPARHNASPIWKGIIKARDQLHNGFKYRLGDGKTSMWYTDWTGQGKIVDRLPFVHISDTNICLQDLIHNQNWNFNRIMTMLPEDVENSFTKIVPQLAPDRPDMWTWNCSDAGIYSVREGYQWLQEQKLIQVAGERWNWIWKLKIPEKVRIFTWLCLHDALPVNSNRVKCHLATSAACDRCSAPREDIIHSLRECPHSREIWGRLGVWSWPNFWNLDLVEWIHFHGRISHAIRFLAGIWGIWKWRCNMVLDDRPWPLEIAWRKLQHDHDDFIRFLQHDMFENGQGMLHKGWRPPQTGFLKLNTDGSYLPETARMGGGGLLRDSAGKWVQGFISAGVDGSAFLADGLKLAWNNGVRQIQCESDCRELVSCVQDQTRSMAHIHGMILQEIRELLSRDWRIELSWCNRESNDAAIGLQSVDPHYFYQNIRWWRFLPQNWKSFY